ncbi:MAG: 16S rRNA (uracil(1498)-N(3))-methyltransferase [Pseudomonadota bacterium]
MNLVLFDASELQLDGRLELKDHRFTHIQSVLKKSAGDTVRVGELGGNTGIGRIESCGHSSITLVVQLAAAPPPALDLLVVLALPRPKMLRRSLRAMTEAGVKRIVLTNGYHVEKSYWQSPVLQEDSLREICIGGLEQTGDTLLPSISMERRFRPFAEDRLPALLAGRTAILADGAAETAFASDPKLPAALLIGPERGFIPFEKDLLYRAGAVKASLGARTLRVETALQCALGLYLVSQARKKSGGS